MKKSAKSTKNAKAAAKAKLTAKISKGQWDLPAGFAADGQNFASLRDMVDPQVATMSLAQLSPEQRSKLVSERISRQPKFELAMVGAGLVDKDRAIAEVEAQSEVGKLLMEIEQNAIQLLMKSATPR